ncbi:MAG: DUF501 domain-containing protein [Thermovirgaceae bacterium]
MPPLFFEKTRPADLNTIREQVAGRKFDTRILLGLAARCRLGAPSVILCRPLFKGRPFPTTFWLTCPHVAKECDALEAGGGVAKLETFLAKKPDVWREYGVWHSLVRLALVSPAERRFLFTRRKSMWEDMRKGRIGGTRDTGQVRVKCLHLQTASWLALGCHPGEKWLRSRISTLCRPGSGYPCRKTEGSRV